MQTSTTTETDRLLAATRRYSTLCALDDARRDYGAVGYLGHHRHVAGYDIPVAAWLGLADRLITEALWAMLRGGRLQFVVDRVNDCYRRANSDHRWMPRILPAYTTRDEVADRFQS